MKRFFALSMIASLGSAGCAGRDGRNQGQPGVVGGATSDLSGTGSDPVNRHGAGPGETTGSPVNPPGSAASPVASSAADPSMQNTR